LGNDIIEAFNVLNIQRGVDIYSGIQQFFNILVTFGMPGTGNICMSKFIDEDKDGRSRACIQVKLLESDPRYSIIFRGIRSSPSSSASVSGCHGSRHTRPEYQCLQSAAGGCPEHLVGLPDTAMYPRKIFSLPRFFVRSSLCTRARSTSGSGRHSGTIP